MSVRAYKIKEIVTEEDPTFNCWHNQEIVDLGNLNHYDGEGGYISFDRDVIDEKLKTISKEDDNYEILQDILKDMGDDTYVEYLCY